MFDIDDFGAVQPVWIPYPYVLRQHIQNVMRMWENFCKRPLAVKERFTFNESHSIGDAGYEFRAGDVDKRVDAKETFHITKSEIERLLSYTDGDLTFDDGRDFLLAAERMEKECSPFIIQFAVELSRKFSSLPRDFVDRVRASRDLWSYRFLHYLPGSNEVIALPHTDKAGFAPHLACNLPGLQYLAKDRATWLRMDPDKYHTVIIPGMQMQYLSGGEVKALCHRVVSIPQSRARGRTSLVCFPNIVDAPQYDKKRVGRSQDLAPGYNYDMSHEEFAKLFA